MGKRFLRQHPIFNESDGSFWFYIVDFYCPSDRIVVELDGSSHEGREDVDKERSEVIEANRIRIVRFRNEEVENDSGRVLLQLRELMNG